MLKWLQMCPSCDAGLGAPCTHPDEDYRPMIFKLLQERDRARTTAERVPGLLDLIAELTDTDRCEYDHHGYCQTHGLHADPCPHGRAKALLVEEVAVTEANDAGGER